MGAKEIISYILIIISVPLIRYGCRLSSMTKRHVDETEYGAKYMSFVFGGLFLVQGNEIAGSLQATVLIISCTLALIFSWEYLKIRYDI